ncbi:hypothetical protein ABPG75_008498 [Micractinium tetrahymenae]
MEMSSIYGRVYALVSLLSPFFVALPSYICNHGSPASSHARGAGSWAGGAAVAEADACRRAREFGHGLSKQQLGGDLIRMHDITAAASAQAQGGNQQQGQQPPGLAGLPAALAALQAGVVQVQAQLAALQAQMQAGQAQLAALQAQMQAGQAQLSNERRRRQNALAAAAHPHSAQPLAPLLKEQSPPAGAANAAAVGALPPPGVFPATWAAVQRLNNAQVTALANFYGENFGQHGALAPRQEAFMAFIK